MGWRVCAQDGAARTSTPENRQLIVVEKPGFVIESPPDSAEREGVGADTGVQKLDLESSIGHCPVLSDQLIEARFRHRAPSLRVDIDPMVGTRRSAVERYPEANGLILLG